MNAKKIWEEFLTEDEQAAIDRGRKDFEYTLDSVRELMKEIPSELKNTANDAIHEAITAGEGNGFRAGFNYALKMLEELRAESVRYYAK